MKQSPPLFTGAPAWTSSKPPLLRFLNACHADFASETSGAVADYIPELGKADPAHFGISLATLDGHVYEVGDTQIPFTIQSMSKPFVFALALDTLGASRVESAIGVEPSGDPFNSIRLNAENHPFNPMVNAGAIACSGLIHEAKGDAAFDYIRQALGRFAGRDLDVDDAVYASESTTGDRNRAIGYLLRTNAVIKDNVAAVLEVYFRQCAILVTARDIAVMAATLANRGINPVTGEQVLSAYAISRTLSVMTSSGMYDYAGEWIYRIGIPAKSGVGGGILAALPARLGLGSYSPKLDKHGNSVRGIKVCEALSAHYDLHMLNRSDDARNSIIADYDIGNSPSRRVRRAHEQNILAAHPQLKAVFGESDAMGLGAAKAAQQANRHDGMQFVGIDGFPTMFDGVKSGLTQATMAQQPYHMGEIAVDNAIQIMEGGAALPAEQYQDTVLINKDTVDQNDVTKFYGPNAKSS